MTEGNQIDLGRISFIIGVIVIIASIIFGLFMVNILESASPDIWAPFFLIVYGLVAIAIGANFIGLMIGILQVVSEKKKDLKPTNEAIAGIVLNSLLISLVLIYLFSLWFRDLIPNPNLVSYEILPTSSVLTIQSQSTQDAIQSSAETVVRAYVEAVIVNDWYSARKLFLSPYSNDQETFSFGVERCSGDLAAGYEITLWQDINEHGIVEYVIDTEDGCGGIILVQYMENKYFIYTAKFSV